MQPCWRGKKSKKGVEMKLNLWGEAKKNKTNSGKTNKLCLFFSFSFCFFFSVLPFATALPPLRGGSAPLDGRRCRRHGVHVHQRMPAGRSTGNCRAGVWKEKKKKKKKKKSLCLCLCRRRRCRDRRRFPCLCQH